MNRLWWLLVVLIALFLPPLAVHARTLDENVIELFPKNVSQIAYIDLGAARQLPWFAQFQQQVLPPTVITLQQFLVRGGINPSTQVNEVVWARVATENDLRQPAPPGQSGAGILGILLGDFDPGSIQTVLDALNQPKVELNGYDLYSCGIGPECGNMYVFFLDSNTVAFGQLETLKQLIHVKDQSTESLLANEKMTALIDQVNGANLFWDVSNGIGARQVLQEFVPGISKFDSENKMLDGVKSIVVSAQSFDDIELNVQVGCSSPNDSLILSQVLSAGSLVRQYQAFQSKPALAQMLAQATISAKGNFTDVSIEVSNDQLIGLIEENAFVAGD